MNRLNSKITNAQRRANRVRTKIGQGHPRLSIFISNRSVYAQIIDDHKQVTIVSAKSSDDSKSTLTEKAQETGKEIAKKAKVKKIKKVTFDRGSRLYHGRVKAFAESARKEGLEF